MEKSKKSKGSFLGLVPLCVFLILYFAIGIGTGGRHINTHGSNIFISRSVLWNSWGNAC